VRGVICSGREQNSRNITAEETRHIWHGHLQTDVEDIEYGEVVPCVQLARNLI
jgi:hypothetical protein